MNPRPVFKPVPRGLVFGFAALLAAGLAGCSMPKVTDPASPYYDLPTGSTLTLRRDIEIPLGYARAVLQGGQAGPAASLRRYEGFCELEVDAVSERSPQTVRADLFTITRVWRQQDLGAAERTVRLAALGAGANLAGGIGLGLGVRFGGDLQFGGLDNDGGGQLVLNVLHLRLHSAAQPQVRELRCTSGWSDHSAARYPSLVDLRGTLGELASIEPGAGG